MAIRIHPTSANRQTDESAVNELHKFAPTGARKAQDVLVAAKKQLAGSSIFSSDKARRKKLQNECYQLRDCLNADGYESEKLSGFLSAEQGDVVMNFLSMHSDAYPNWQNEYDLLNRMIPLYFK